MREKFYINLYSFTLFVFFIVISLLLLLKKKINEIKIVYTLIKKRKCSEFNKISNDVHTLRLACRTISGRNGWFFGFVCAFSLLLSFFFLHAMNKNDGKHHMFSYRNKTRSIQKIGSRKNACLCQKSFTFTLSI